MKNHWLKKYRQEKLMEDAIAIYRLSREKRKEIDLGPSGLPILWLPSERGFVPSISGMFSKWTIKDRIKGPSFFPDDLDMSNESLSHHHNWIKAKDERKTGSR